MPKPRGRTPLAKLHKHWKRASPEERQAFLDQVGPAQSTRPARRQAHQETKSDTLIANGRYLLPATVRRIEAIMVTRRIGPSDVVEDLGYPDQAVALTRALTQQSSLRLAIIAALTAWIDENEARPDR
ncbi:hypothetical protein [Rhizobium sp. SL86]|uniref:hypothetical protein n=1 Tax=Rhizobium sp. SL86 TaxID=2995148 RepID=UPI0022739305|nr:hypothetical protein [Rhizobium sp. SL86]MCY1665450.1 hypothetical protein [Rhizobium sp. SL86]